MTRVVTAAEKARIGREGEDAFQAWLDANGFSYVKVCQKQTSFAQLFHGNVKRPDFLVLIDSVGLIAVDVKCKEVFGKGYSLSHGKEFRLSLAFERIFRLPVWYAYRGPDGSTWYWISALKAVEVGIEREDSQGEKFLELNLKDFARVRTNEDFGQLYLQRMPQKVRRDNQKTSGSRT